MEVYGADINGAPEMVFDKADSVAIVSNLIEGEVSYQTLSRVVKERLTPLLEKLYSEGKYYCHFSLTSKRDIIAGEELVKFKQTHPEVKIFFYETTLQPESISDFNSNDVKRYWKISDNSDLHIFQPIRYGQEKNQTLNIIFGDEVSTFIAYGDCNSSAYLSNCNFDIRYLLTDAEMWPDEVDVN